MSTEFGRLLAEVLHSMDSGAVFEKLKAVMNIYEHNLKLEARIVELESENSELRPYRDGYDADKQLPEEGKVVIASFADMLLLASLSGGRWYDAIKPHQRIRGVDRWWKLPEVQE